MGFIDSGVHPITLYLNPLHAVSKETLGSWGRGMVYVLAVLGSLDYGYFVIAELDRKHKQRTWVIENNSNGMVWHWGGKQLRKC